MTIRTRILDQNQKLSKLQYSKPGFDWLDERITTVETDIDRLKSHDFSHVIRQVLRESPNLNIGNQFGAHSQYYMEEYILDEVKNGSKFYYWMRQSGVFLSIGLAFGVLFFGEAVFFPLFLSLGILLAMDLVSE